MNDKLLITASINHYIILLSIILIGSTSRKIGTSYPDLSGLAHYPTLPQLLYIFAKEAVTGR